MSEMNTKHPHEHEHHDHHDHGDSDHSHKAASLSPRDDRYWLSLEQWAKDPAFEATVSQEFASSPLRPGEEVEDKVARRDFLKLMGASMALATASCVRRPAQTIVPYAKQPEEITLGVANHYTSTWFDGSEPVGILVTTREGRPIKIEGNRRHPLQKGGLNARAQAHILSLYDPERLKGPQQNLLNKERTNRDTVGAKWEDLDQKIADQLKKGSAVLLTGSVASPSTRELMADFTSAFKAKHVSWQPLSFDDVRQGQKLAYGEETVPQYRFDKARMIVSIDTDFMGTWLMPTAFMRQFADGRKNHKTMNRLVSFESVYTLTGANADIRFKMKPSQQVAVVMGLLHEIVVVKGHSKFASDARLKSILEKYNHVAADLGFKEEEFKAVAHKLMAHAGESLVVAGGLPTRTESSSALQVAVNLLNSVLGNDGKTVLGKSGSAYQTASQSEVQALIADMKDKKVKTLIIHGLNPVYSLPNSKEFVEALKNVEMVITTAGWMDETALVSHYVLPDHHSMESWGDMEAVAGVYSIHQPTLRPLYDSRSFQLSLMSWAQKAKVGSKKLAVESYYDYLRNFWKETLHPKLGQGKSFEDFWQAALQTGVVGEPASSAERSFRTEALSTLQNIPSKTGYELVLYPTIAIGDGSAANIAWLQELPDPVTKIVWDNYVSVSIKTAEKLKVKESSVVELKVGDKTLELPVHIQPGQHDDVMAVAIGYGRQAAGKVGNGIGQNAYPLASVKKDQVLFSGLSVDVKTTKKKYELANPQGHHAMEGRQIVVETNLKDFERDAGSGIHRHKIWNIWSGHEYNGHKWGIGVDLNACTGCSACMIACQSENNVPVVGKKYVIQGREMHWIRVDRYYVGNPEDAQVVYQPLMCQQCDNAPCETVCPVAATVHTDEGLNDMAYNRCVGTRYCANNCSYKVRRFNWFSYISNIEKPLQMAFNPEVGVRMRGVMEKCTFCVQRIKAGKSAAKLEQRPLKDGEIQTACQQSCPTDAIVFGDLNDKDSQVSKMFSSERAYALLEEFHAAPAVRYLSKIRNNDKESATHGHSQKGEHS